MSECSHVELASSSTEDGKGLGNVVHHQASNGRSTEPKTRVNGANSTLATAVPGGASVLANRERAPKQLHRRRALSVGLANHGSTCYMVSSLQVRILTIL